jgi:hypothetical protein
MRKLIVATLFAIPVLQLASAKAATITDGFTFTVASSCGQHVAGSHYHSNTGGSFGNPAGKAEVGSYFCEETQGLSEYNIAGLSPAGPAFVTFNVYNKNGLFGIPDKGDLTIELYAYQGNNQENISDFSDTVIGYIDKFNTSGLTVGDVISFDVNTLLDAAIANGDNSFGVRLRPKVFAGDMATWTFDTFRLTTDDQSKPVPGPLPVLGAAAALGFSRKLRQRIKSSSSS